MLKFIGGILVARWFLGILGVVIGAGIVYWAVKQVAGTADVAG